MVSPIGSPPPDYNISGNGDIVVIPGITGQRLTAEGTLGSWSGSSIRVDFNDGTSIILKIPNKLDLSSFVGKEVSIKYVDSPTLNNPNLAMIKLI